MSKRYFKILFFVLASLIFLGLGLFSLPPNIAHAQLTPTPANTTVPWSAQGLHCDLTSGCNASTAWVMTVWKVCMGLANAFVALALIFFAAVNIAHIDYDTYQLKKTFPKLIIGIILANFSLVICRMFADIASVITATFANNGLRALFEGVLAALGLTPTASIGDAMAMYFFSNVLILWLIIIILAIFLGILVLGLLLLVRHAVILILAAAAPIAFIMLAFPPTEQYFKKWWEWWINWIFMGPIIMFMLWMAGEVGRSNFGTGFNVTASMAALLLVFLAAIVPFKLGGAVMEKVGQAGKLAGNAAWNNPYSKLKRKEAGLWAKRNTPYGQMAHNYNAAMSDLDAEEKADASKYEENRRMKRAQDVQNGKHKETIEAEEQRRIEAELDLKTGTSNRTKDYVNSVAGGHGADKALEAQLAAQDLDTTKRRRNLQAYNDPTKQSRIKKIEADAANTEADLKKITNNLQTAHGDNQLRGVAEIARNPELEAAHKAVAEAQANLVLNQEPDEVLQARRFLDEAEASGDQAQIGAAQSLLNDAVNANLPQVQAAQAARDALNTAKQAEQTISDRTLDGVKKNIAREEDALTDPTITDQERAAIQQRLDGYRRVQVDITEHPTNLKDAMKLVQSAETDVANARTPEEEAARRAVLSQRQQAAAPLLDQAAQRLVDQKQLNKDKQPPTVFTHEEAVEYLKQSNISDGAEKRYYAITAGRAADDISSDAKSYPPKRVVGEFYDDQGRPKEMSYSGFSATREDGPAFFRGEALSSGEAGQCIATNLGQLREQSRDIKTAGASFLALNQIIGRANPELNGGVLGNAWKMSASAKDDRVRTDLLRIMKQSGIITDPSATVDQVTSTHLQQMATRVQLDPNGNPSHKTFLNYANSQYAEADGRSYEYTDDQGHQRTTLGRTGMGQSPWFHAKNSTDITGKIEGPAGSGAQSTGGSTTPPTTGGTGGGGTTTNNTQTTVNNTTTPATPGGAPGTPAAAPQIILSPGAQWEQVRIQQQMLRTQREMLNQQRQNTGQPPAGGGNGQAGQGNNNGAQDDEDELDDEDDNPNM